jgi:DNA-binding transcriptional regulator PaaX
MSTIATMNGDTRSRMFGVLVLIGKPVSARELVALCRPLGISATNVKSHLTRLVTEGALIRTGRRRTHRYAISPLRQRFVHAVSSRLQLPPAERWDEQWLMVAMKSQTRRAERQRLRSRLWFDGFRPCGPDTYLRPAWPRAWAVARAQGLAGAASACVIGPLVGTLQLDQVRKLYRLTRIDAQACRLARRIDAIGDRLADPAGAFKDRLTVGGLVVELVSHVPNLPPVVWGDLTGLQDLQSAYAAFEARVVGPAETFVEEILSGSRRREGPSSRMRPRRVVKNRAVVHTRAGR